MDKPKNKLNVDQLLNQMGGRTKPKSSQAEVSKAAVKAHWQQMIQQKKQQRQQKYLWALAASVFLSASLVIFNLNTKPIAQESLQLATVSDYSGDVRVRKNDSSNWHTLQANETILSNSSFKTTNDSFVSLRLTDGSEIRVGDNSELSWTAQTITLSQGKIYHDTDDAIPARVAPLTITTTNGLIQHIGTRYMVSQQGTDVEVAVRSGAVKLTQLNSATDDEQTIEHSQLVKIDQTGAVKVEQVSAFDPLWDWTFSAQAGYDLDNKSLFQFVQWFAQQSGYTVDWQSFESQSKRVRLTGNIKNMQPELAISTVFSSTQFSYKILENGVLQISKQ